MQYRASVAIVGVKMTWVFDNNKDLTVNAKIKVYKVILWFTDDSRMLDRILQHEELIADKRKQARSRRRFKAQITTQWMRYLAKNKGLGNAKNIGEKPIQVSATQL